MSQSISTDTHSDEEFSEASSSPQRRWIPNRHGWKSSEDAKLKRLVQLHGDNNWVLVASGLLGREPKQCRERWINHLAPGICKGKLSEDEWNKVQQLRIEFGNRWSEIARFLPGRTPNQIKNYYHSMLRGRKIGTSEEETLPSGRKRSREELDSSHDSGEFQEKKRRLDETPLSSSTDELPSQLRQSLLLPSFASTFDPAKPISNHATSLFITANTTQPHPLASFEDLLAAAELVDLAAS